MYSGDIEITGSANELGATLWIGYFTDYSETGGGNLQIVGMTNNLTLLNGVGINVGYNSSFWLNQVDPSAGGNIVTGGALSIIYVDGGLSRSLDDSLISTANAEHIDVTVGFGLKGVFGLGDYTKLKILTPGSVYDSLDFGGVWLDMGYGSLLKTDNPVVLGNGGMLLWDTATISASVYLTGGFLTVGGSGSGYGTSNVDGDFYINGGTLIVYLDGSTNGQNSSLVATGTIYMSAGSATLDIITNNQAPSSGNSYTILSSTGGITGTDFGAFDTWDSFDLYTTNYYTPSGPGGYTYYLSVP